eukprot:TRINITY_DN3757_c0_g3_i1.p1 TRINITY_DN3757_c0_g3~~TRINITY_DN3757_c0_g3_i1.p1  ORF type:complete len:205 (+),score=-25.40 TRINITY_DN3757_c0_g3_i1:738-1352(+)
MHQYNSNQLLYQFISQNKLRFINQTQNCIKSKKVMEKLISISRNNITQVAITVQYIIILSLKSKNQKQKAHGYLTRDREQNLNTIIPHNTLYSLQHAQQACFRFVIIVTQCYRIEISMLAFQKILECYKMRQNSVFVGFFYKIHTQITKIQHKNQQIFVHIPQTIEIFAKSLIPIKCTTSVHQTTTSEKYTTILLKIDNSHFML